MTGWIIFGSIVLLILIVLWQSVTITFVYEKELDLKIKFLGFTVFDINGKPKKEKKKKKPKKQKIKKSQKEQSISRSPSQPVKSTETDLPLKEKESISEESEAPSEKKVKKPKKEKPNIDLEMIMDYVRSAAPPLKRLFKKIRWYDVYVDWVVGSDDAAKTAITYGSICAFLYPFFEWLTTYFTAHVKEVNIEADFSKEESDIFAYFVLKLRLSTALACIIWLAVRVLKTYMAYNQQPTPAKPKKAGKKGK